MSTSEAECFRTLQAQNDLRTIIASASGETLSRIGSAIPGRRIARDTAPVVVADFADGAALDPGRRRDVLTALRRTAALPQDDFQAFLIAKMILLAEALRTSDDAEPADWHWHAFREHYRVAAAVERAAIVQAIRRIGLVRGETDDLPVTVPDRATAPTAALRPLIERHCPRGLAPPDPVSVPGLAMRLLAAFDDIDVAEEAAVTWKEHGADLIERAPREILAGFRHLYEMRDGWAPHTRVTLPVFNPPPGVDWPY